MVEFVVSKNNKPKKARLVEFIKSPFTKYFIFLQYACFFNRMLLLTYFLAFYILKLSKLKELVWKIANPF